MCGPWGSLLAVRPLASDQPERVQTILVVDDEDDIRDSLRELLEASIDRVQVRTAASGAEAAEILTRETVDLLITDYKMPGMNGLELLSHARAVVPRTPRILITAFPDLDLAIRAVNEAKIENFFTKPLEPDAVVEIVRAVLLERRAAELRNQAFARSLDLLRRQARPTE